MLELVKRRNTELQERLDHNEEEIKWQRKMLNHLLIDVEKEAIEEWRMEQQLEVLEQTFHLMLKH